MEPSVRVYFCFWEGYNADHQFLQDKQLTIALQGEIDHHGAKATLRMVEEKIDQYMPSQCILDFRGVSFMDSSGIAVVIHTLRRMNRLGENCALPGAAAAGEGAAGVRHRPDCTNGRERGLP